MKKLTSQERWRRAAGTDSGLGRWLEKQLGRPQTPWMIPVGLAHITSVKEAMFLVYLLDRAEKHPDGFRTGPQRFYRSTGIRGRDFFHRLVRKYEQEGIVLTHQEPGQCKTFRLDITKMKEYLQHRAAGRNKAKAEPQTTEHVGTKNEANEEAQRVERQDTPYVPTTCLPIVNIEKVVTEKVEPKGLKR